ncbi:hypothetical protein C8R47DRAFT_1132915 [Mycena vitilis]|nr:hypothetical protein C8R47DRAFT_1132915 [Mycena vitilis]
MATSPTTSGEAVVQLLRTTYQYSRPVRRECRSIATKPFRPPLTPLLRRLPAFIVSSRQLKEKLVASLATTITALIHDKSLDHEQVIRSCETFTAHAEGQDYPHFGDREIATEGDVAAIATTLEGHLNDFLKKGYKKKLRFREQPALSEQRPDRFLVVDEEKRTVWEDKSWLVFELRGPEIVHLAESPGGRELIFQGEEQHARAILFKIAITMYDTGSWWGLVFGGEGALLFQRVSSEEDSRYGLVCSDILPIDDLYIVVLATLLVPGDIALTNLVPYGIPTPAPCLPPDIQQLTRQNTRQLGLGVTMEVDENIAQHSGSFDHIESDSLSLNIELPGYLPTTLHLNARSTFERLESPPDSPPLRIPTPPPSSYILSFFSKKDVPCQPSAPFLPLVPQHEIHITRTPSIGATGLVFQGTTDHSPLIIKAIPPGWSGVSDLTNEANMYNVLVSLQGTVVPRFYGHFEGQGWSAIVLEDCGTFVAGLDELSRAQRDTALDHARAIHGCGVMHNDLEPRNIVKTPSGAIRLIDFAFSTSGHDCVAANCVELDRFSTLLSPLAV